MRVPVATTAITTAGSDNRRPVVVLNLCEQLEQWRPGVSALHTVLDQRLRCLPVRVVSGEHRKQRDYGCDRSTGC